MAKQNVSSQQNPEPQSKGILKWIETVGNKLPHPFWLFVWITY
jgi:aminobenzoyl-glutamate transport protein